MEKNTLYKFFQGISSREEEQQIVDWLDMDPANEKTFNEERRLYNTFIMMDEKEIPSNKPETRRMPRWTRELMRTAAVLVLTAGIGIYFYSRLEQRIDLSENSISVPVGQHLDITMSDGTKVTVNGSSTITYPAVFTGKERRVRLSGEAFFEVTHDTKHPFVVETSQCDVEVLGTEFNVEAYGESGEFTASLVNGKVKVTNHNGMRESIELAPNQQVRLVGDMLLVERIPEYESFQWRDGLIAFRNATFADLMELFEKYYGFRIVYNAGQVPAATFTGKIRISEGIDHAFWALQQNASFKYEKNADNMTVTIN